MGWSIWPQEKKSKDVVVSVRCKAIKWFPKTEKDTGLPMQDDDGNQLFGKIKPILRIVLVKDGQVDDACWIHYISGKTKSVVDWLGKTKTVRGDGYVYHYPDQVEYNVRPMWVNGTHYAAGTYEVGRKELREDKMNEERITEFLTKRHGADLAQEIIACFEAHLDELES